VLIPLLLVIGLVSTVSGQFVSGVDLVEVYATVTDAKGEPISGLGQDDFSVTEDGQPQTVTAFAQTEVPLAVAVAVDRSFSVPPQQLKHIVGGAARFIRALRPGDLVMVLAIGSEIEIVAPLSTDRDAAVRSLAQVAPWGTTPLYDAARRSLDMIHAVAGRRALILLSDGIDRYSRTSAAELLDHARRRNVLVYPVAIGRTRPAIFAELARATGGRSAHVSNGVRLPATLDAIGTELRSQYLLGYSPGRPKDLQARWRAIRVAVSRPNAQIRAREGYFGP
jgi:Ca-activated chloride channel family protein